MPEILIYLLKVNIALLLFCLGYYLVLRRLTFYTLNRVYLITAILFSSLYPQINFNTVVEQHEKLVQPLQVIVIELNTKAAKFAMPVTQNKYWDWLVIVFWTGVAFMALRLAVQLWSLYKIYKRSAPAQVYNYKVRVINEEANPFSFWQSIFINPRQHSAHDLQSIIAHEQIHVKQWHTLDILLAEFSLIFYWFNPGVWLMKKAVAENLEFITDRKILQQGIDAKSYQYSLLYASFNTSPNAIVNHFNISTIKKRIMMMNSKKSSAFSLTRYGFIAPAVLALLLVFGTTKAAFIKKTFNSAQIATGNVIGNLSETKEHITINSNSNHTKEVIAGFEAILINKALAADTAKYNMTSKTSFTGPDSAYYILNGKPMGSKLPSSINPNDISSIHVIHPPAATKLFGPKAAKGVIFFITKGEENTTLNKEALAKIMAIKQKGSPSKTGIISIKTPKDELHSITITGKPDSTLGENKGTLTSITIKGTHDDHSTPVKGRVNGIRINGTKDTTVKEVVIVGYGSATTKTKSTVSVHGPESKASPSKKVFISGVSSTTDTPKKAITIKLTGAGKAVEGQPLYFLDGKPTTGLESVDPDNIERVDVLKDQAATSVYGERAANGVVLITTKEAAKAAKKKSP